MHLLSGFKIPSDTLLRKPKTGLKVALSRNPRWSVLRVKMAASPQLRLFERGLEPTDILPLNNQLTEHYFHLFAIAVGYLLMLARAVCRELKRLTSFVVMRCDFSGWWYTYKGEFGSDVVCFYLPGHWGQRATSELNGKVTLDIVHYLTFQFARHEGVWL